MFVKAYLSLWVVFALAAAVIFATGNFTMFTAVVFGFVAFGLTFMGMMNVLPEVVSHPAPPKPIQPAPEVKPSGEREPAKAFGVLKSA